MPDAPPEAALRYLAHAPVKELIDIPRMADIAHGMLRDALDSFVRRDTLLAQQVQGPGDRARPARELPSG